MNLLALDTATEQLSLAISHRDACFSYDEVVGNASSSHVLPQINTLLTKANLTLAALDGIAFGTGPGSFTGVRIATGVTQGLALAHHLPVVGVCTLISLAEASGTEKVIVCTDARMGEVYHAAYEKINNDWQIVFAPSVCPPEKVPAVTGEGWTAVGSGWRAYAEALQHAYQGQIKHIDADAMPSAKAMLTLAAPAFEKGEGKAASEAIPLYVRNRVALTTAQRAAGERL